MGTRVAMEMELDVAGIRQRLMNEDNGESICAKCEQIKPRSEFYNHKKSPIGIYYSCKTCQEVTVNESRARRKFNEELTTKRNIAS